MTLCMCLDCWACRWIRVCHRLLWSQSASHRLWQHDLRCSTWFHIMKLVYHCQLIVIDTTKFMMLPSRQSHCKSSPGECRTALGGRRLLDQANQLVLICLNRDLSSLCLLLLSQKADTHSTIPWRVEVWVNLGGLLHTEMVYLPAGSHPSHS